MNSNKNKHIVLNIDSYRVGSWIGRIHHVTFHDNSCIFSLRLLEQHEFQDKEHVCSTHLKRWHVWLGRFVYRSFVHSLVRAKFHLFRRRRITIYSSNKFYYRCFVKHHRSPKWNVVHFSRNRFRSEILTMCGPVQ